MRIFIFPVILLSGILTLASCLSCLTCDHRAADNQYCDHTVVSECPPEATLCRFQGTFAIRRQPPSQSRKEQEILLDSLDRQCVRDLTGLGTRCEAGDLLKPIRGVPDWKLVNTRCYCDTPLCNNMTDDALPVPLLSEEGAVNYCGSSQNRRPPPGEGYKFRIVRKGIDYRNLREYHF